MQNIEAVYPHASTVTRALANFVYTDLLKGKLITLNTVVILIFIYIYIVDERLSNIQPKYEATLKLFYLSAEKEPQKQAAYIPYPHSKSLDFQQLHALQNKLPDSCVFIAIADNTGNILYYQLTEGICDKL